MTVEVKICGLKTEAALDAALGAGADYVGLVFCAASPRNLDFETAHRLAERARGRAKIVTLLVDPDDTLLELVVAAVAPDIIQLHGSETPQRVAEVVKAARPPGAEGGQGGGRRRCAWRPHLCRQGRPHPVRRQAPSRARGAHCPAATASPSTGEALAGVRGKLDYMLAGGLTPANVAEAIRLTGASAVDVSSGVESRPGEKDPELIRSFLHAAKTARADAIKRGWRPRAG